jgi:hypothetical protein
MQSENGISMLDGHGFVPGRIVRYLDAERKYFPMLLTACHQGPFGRNKASGVIFGEFGVKYLAAVDYDQAQKPGSWSWPLRNRAKKKSPETKPAPGKPLCTPKTK